jgi:hypothetical protein
MKLSCQKATELVEKQSLVGLSVIDRLKLSMHLKMCDACKSYKDHSHKIDALLKDQTAPSFKLSESVKEDIIRKCEE